MISFLPFLFFSVVSAAIAPFNGGFDRDACLARTLAHLDDNTLDPSDGIFFRDASGQPLSGQDNITLTLPGCRLLCGERQAWYWDVGPRISTWLAPILILLSNVALSPLDKRRFLAILHLLGDPIHSISSLIHKIDTWDRCWHLARQYGAYCDDCKRVVATVFAGFEEIEGPRIDSRRYFDTLADEHGLATHFPEWRRTALKLADSRTDEFLRTCLALLLYIFSLIASFIKEVGGESSSPPGGRVATGVFLSWLVPTVLLSNVVGNFPSRRTCYEILGQFAERTGDRLRVPRSQSVCLPGFPYLKRACSTDFFHSLGWSGGIYTFRPWAAQYLISERRWPRVVLVHCLSITPIFIGVIGGFIILWFGLPIGPNCRHTWLVGIFLAWVVSALATQYSNSPKFATGKYHWRFILVKDALIAMPSITVIFLSACGLFNSCSCWSGFLSRPESAHVPLNGDPFYELNDRTVYPSVVGISLVLQLLIFVAVVVIWRRGLKLFWWSESAREKGWERIVGHEVCKCMHSLKAR